MATNQGDIVSALLKYFPHTIHEIIYNVPFHLLSLKTCRPLGVEMRGGGGGGFTITLSYNKSKLALVSASCLLVTTIL